MRFVSRQEVEAIGLEHEELVGALEAAFRAGAAGEIVWRPKSTIVQPDGAVFIGTLATWPKRNLGIFHSIVGAPPANLAAGEPPYRSYQLLTDYARGSPIATIDGSLTSSLLPAGITAIGARHFARPDSRVAAFVGAGDQARVNLAGLLPILPLQEVRILSRTAAGAERFAQEVRAKGLFAKVATSAEEVLQGADVIVSSVPSGPQLRPFLDPAWVAPGAFVSAVDLGRSWKEGFNAFDRIVIDDRAQAVAQRAEGRLFFAGTFDTELPELITGVRPPRVRAAERIVLIHPGNIVGVLGITALIHERLLALQ